VKSSILYRLAISACGFYYPLQFFVVSSSLLAGVLDYGRAKVRSCRSHSPYSGCSQSPFGPSVCSQMPRVTTLVVAPTLLVAANFILLGRVIRRLGPQYSRLTPKLCESHILFSLSRIGLNVDIDAIVFLFCVSIPCPCKTRVLLTVL
jgi:hypothetical protein